MKKILILSSAESVNNIAALELFRKNINNQLGAEYNIITANYQDIGIEADANGVIAYDIRTQDKLDSFDFVYFKSYYRYSEIAVSIAEYLQSTNTNFICSELKNYISFSKLSQYAKLARAGLPLPKTCFFYHTRFADKYQKLQQVLGATFICKAIDGKGGDLNFLVKTESQFNDITKTYPNVDFVCQEFIPNSSDLRVLIAGNDIKLIIERRRASDDTHLNNTSQGANATLLDVATLSNEARDIALKTARLFGREIAGVDIMFRDGDDKPYILEINASPQVSTGAFTDEKIHAYATLFKESIT